MYMQRELIDGEKGGPDSFQQLLQEDETETKSFMKKHENRHCYITAYIL